MHMLTRTNEFVPHKQSNACHDQAGRDDWFLVRVPKGLRYVLFEAKPEGEASLLNNVLPGMDGVELVSLSQAKQSDSPCPARDECAEAATIMAGLKAGAADLTGKPAVSMNPRSRFLCSFKTTRSRAAPSENSQAAQKKFSKLTSRERDVLALVLAGQPNKIIAADLEISQRTVESHRAAVMRKTSATSLPALVRLALSAGLQNV